jgi:spermidine synthase
MFARDSFWCIAQTIQEAGLQTFPYHVYVPSFGEWGFVLGSNHGYQKPETLPDGLRFLNAQALSSMFEFPNDMGPMKMQPNRLNDQVLVRLYDQDWKDVSH